LVATTPAYPSISWGWWGRSPVKHLCIALFSLFSTTSYILRVLLSCIILLITFLVILLLIPLIQLLDKITNKINECYKVYIIAKYYNELIKINFIFGVNKRLTPIYYAHEFGGKEIVLFPNETSKVIVAYGNKNYIIFCVKRNSKETNNISKVKIFKRNFAIERCFGVSYFSSLYSLYIKYQKEDNMFKDINKLLYKYNIYYIILNYCFSNKAKIISGFILSIILSIINYIITYGLNYIISII
jgi:hypothetical protein